MLNAGDLSPLPPEVIEEILSYCHRSEFLQLRLVSRSIRTFVDTSCKFDDALANYKETNFGPSFEIFAKHAPPFPFSNFHILNTNVQQHAQHNRNFYIDDPFLTIFKESYCPRIRKLRIDHMFCCTLEGELEFFSCLSNLRDLRISTLMSKHYVKQSEAMQYLPFTGPNRLIKRLTVDVEKKSGEYLIELIRNCPALEFLKVPQSLEEPEGASEETDDDCLRSILRLGAEGHLQHLQGLDLNFHDTQMNLFDEEQLQFFGKMVANKKFRLMNVVPDFVLSVRKAVGVETFEQFRQRIASFNGMSDLLKADDLSNLKELSIEFDDWVCRESEWTMDSRLINLPALKKLHVEISDTPRRYAMMSQNSIKCLFNRRNPRISVSELTIIYDRNDRAASRHLWIKPEYLDETFPNLTYLFVETDRFSAGELERLVRVVCRKELLEELSLRTSAGITVGAFYGDDLNNPEFLRLRKLRKFALKTNLDWHAQDERRDECRKMDDRMLDLLSRMSLTHLYIAGWGWDGVTCGGIEGLTKGAFGKSVLRVRLACVEATPRPKSQQGKYCKVREMLERVAHGNRMAKGLTFTSFHGYKASMGNLYSSKVSDSWIDESFQY